MKKRPYLLIILILALGITILIIKYASNSSYQTASEKSDSKPVSISMAPASSDNIEVLSPRGGDSVKSGLAIKGNARTFESSVAIRLSDSEGNVLVETFTLANAPDAGQFGLFEKALEFQTDDSTGTLEVFQYSAKDGSEIDKVTIPLLFN